MNEEQVLDALRKGAILRFSDSGEVTVLALDDLPPAARECFRASKEHDHGHFRRCSDCLESEAENVVMDAASHRQAGNEAIALELEAEAQELRSRAAEIHESRRRSAGDVPAIT